ncbi:MAG: recombinase family protein [Planctomycetota bacterium]|nr:recombinase family protein [Planctomycetota bacterium]
MSAVSIPSPRCDEPDAASSDALQSSSLAFGSSKIMHRHLERWAVVYVRQSDPQQVLQHRESKELQYNLADRAVTLGWPRERVLVIDEDQGESAQSAASRHGFQRLLAEVALDHVGLVLGFQMSRLARSCKDWHQLLEVCARFGTLLTDLDGMYDPADYNDRLLLGLKGTMSEAELHMMCQRMHQGRSNKARRGDFFTNVPIGYVRGESGQAVMDPDEEVQAVVHLVFDKFDELGTAGAVLRYLVAHEIRLGVRRHDGPTRGQLEWRRPCDTTLLSMLHHPIYAGAYSHGRHPIDPRRKEPGRRRTGRTTPPLEAWEVLRKDELPAYITWERFLANQECLQQNCSRVASKGSPRQGEALLGGLLFCRRCGCRMVVGYSGSQNRPRYKCLRDYRQYGLEKCQSLSGAPLDDFICGQVLQVLKPATVELSLKAVEETKQERQRVTKLRRQRLERAQYEADRAARQYHAVEPENRLVARQLERCWEETLVAQREIEEDLRRLEHTQPAELTVHELDMIQALSTDLPALWNATSTTAADRQTISRHLVDRVVVDVQGESEHVDVAIHWNGGFVSQHELIRPVGSYEQLSGYKELMVRVEELRRSSLTSGEIADQLNDEGFHPPSGKTFNAKTIRRLLSRRRPSQDCECPEPPHWRLGDLGRKLDMPIRTLHTWLRRGWLHGQQSAGAHGRWILWADDDELERLKQLRQDGLRSSGLPATAELTTPKPQPKN